MRHVIVGTAGHIDHGKSALVLALTGTDPDRWEEEKRRGITIDLGFAHLDLGAGSAHRIHRRSRPRALCEEHAGGRGRHRSGHADRRRRRVHQTSDARALRHLQAAGNSPRPDRHHQVRLGGPRDAGPGAPGGAGIRRGFVPGRCADGGRERPHWRRIGRTQERTAAAEPGGASQTRRPALSAPHRPLLRDEGIWSGRHRNADHGDGGKGSRG